MLGRQLTRQRQAMSDRADCQRAGPDDPESGIGQRHNALGMHVTVEQADERVVNLSKREGLLLWPHRVLRIVVVGETIRGSSAQGNGLMTFGRTRIQTGRA
jgi:hypothetical protein